MEDTAIDGTQFDGQIPRGRQRFAHLTCDGVAGKDTAAVLELTELMKELRVENVNLVDSRQNTTTARAVSNAIAQGMKGAVIATNDIRGQVANKLKIGGCISVTGQKAARHLGNDIPRTPATFMDKGDGALWIANKICGKKQGSGVQRNLITISAYSPCPGEALHRHLKEKNGKDPTETLIQQIADFLQEQSTPGTGIVLTADFNLNFTKKCDSQREKYKKQWVSKVLKPYNLTNVQRRIHGKGKDPRTYAQNIGKNKGATWIDFVFASESMMQAKAITGIATLDGYGRTGENGKGIIGSLHVPIVYEIDMEEWLDITPEKARTKLCSKARILSAANKKLANDFRERMSAIKLEVKGSEMTVVEAIDWANKTEGTKGELANADEASQILTQIGNRAEEVEQELISEGLRKKKGRKGFKQIWTPGMIKRTYLVKKAERLIRANKVLGRQPKTLAQMVPKEAVAAMEKEGIMPPERTDEGSWQEWHRKTVEQIRKWRKAQHAKRRKKEVGGLSKFKKQVENQRKKQLTKRLVNIIMGRKSNSKLPTELTYYDKEGTHILTDPEEIMEFCAATTEEELGMNRKHWWQNDGEENLHPIAKMNAEGKRAREIAQSGTDEERKELEETIPEHMRQAYRHMKEKYSATPPKETLMEPQTEEEWREKIKKKKAKTANGKSGPHIDAVKCFGEDLFTLCRLLANKGQALDRPLHCFTEQLMYKMHKSEIKDAKKMRPLRFLNTIRKMQTSINKDRLMREVGRRGLIPEEQHAFCGGRSTVGPALWRRHLLEDAMENKKDILLADVDLSAGYDRIPPWVLDALLRRMGIDERTRTYYLNMAEESTIEIITAFGLTRKIKAKAATLVQGCDTSCALWVLLSDWSLDCTKEASKDPYWYETGENEGTAEDQICYADDSTYVQTTTNGMGGVLQSAQNFTQFTGQKVNAGKSAVAVVQWSATGELLPVPQEDLSIELWQTKVEEEDGDIKPNGTSEQAGTVKNGGTLWETHIVGESRFRWIGPYTETRHLGNDQSAVGGKETMFEKIETKAIAGCIALRRRLVYSAAAEQLSKVVIRASARYALSLANATNEEMNKLQKGVKKMLAAKRHMANTTKNEAFYADGIGLGWERWSDVVNQEKLKIVHTALTNERTLVAKIIKGAIYRTAKHTDTDAHPLSEEGLKYTPQKRQETQWLDSLREYMVEQKMEIITEATKDTGKRCKGDFQLAEKATRRDRMILMEHNEMKWASDILAEDGKTMAVNSPANENEEWIRAARNAMGINSSGKRESSIGKITRHRQGHHKWSIKNGVLTQHRYDGAQRTFAKEKLEERRKSRRLQEANSWWKPNSEWEQGKEREGEWVVVNRRQTSPGYKKAVAPHVGAKALYEQGEDHTCDACGDTEREERETDYKCYSCERRACAQHNRGRMSEAGWIRTRENRRTVPSLTWLCEDCNLDHEKHEHEGEIVKIIAKTGIKLEVTEETEDENSDAEEAEEPGGERGVRGHTIIIVNKHAPIRLADAAGNQQTLHIYSDGSKIHGAGSYAWAAGFWRENYWFEIATGKGWESEWDNKTTIQTSTRMEAMGVLRATDWAKQRWAGKTEIRLDNESTIKRFKKRYSNVRKQNWEQPDSDIWEQIRKHNMRHYKLIWVKGHADKDKTHKLTKHEVRNIAVDKLADSAYGEANGRETAESTVGTPQVGHIKIDGCTLTGKMTKTLTRMAKERRAQEWIVRELQGHRAKHAKSKDEQIAAETDMQLLREHTTTLAKHGKFTAYIKIIHSAVATNNVMVRRDTSASGMCPCCGKTAETLNHIISECDELSKERDQMISNIREAIETNLGKTKMDGALIRAITKIWSKDTISHAAGRDETKSAGTRRSKSDMEKVWGEVASEQQKLWLQRITEGGARMLWDGRIHRDFISGMRIFGASNGTAKRTAKSILEAITTNKIKIVDERHRIKHKATEKPKLAAEIKTLWTELDRIKRKTSTSEEAPQRMTADELAEHIKPMKIRKIEEWITRIRTQITAAQSKADRRDRAEKSRKNLEEVEEARKRQKERQKRKTRQTRIREDLEDTDSEEEDESKTRQERENPKRTQREQEPEKDIQAKHTGNGKRKYEEATKEKETRRQKETEATGTNKRGKTQHESHPVGGGNPAERRSSGAAELIVEPEDEESEEEEVEDRKKKRRRLKTRRERKQEKADKLKRERQEKRKKEQEKKRKERDQMEAMLAKWMTTRKEQTNKGQSPEEARGKKGEDITGKRKGEEEENPDRKIN